MVRRDVPWRLENRGEPWLLEDTSVACIWTLRGRCLFRFAAQYSPQDTAIDANRVLRATIQHQHLMPTARQVRMDVNKNDISLANDSNSVRLWLFPTRPVLSARDEKIIPGNHHGAERHSIQGIHLVGFTHDDHGGLEEIREHDGLVILRWHASGTLIPHTTQENHPCQQEDVSHGAPISPKSGQGTSSWRRELDGRRRIPWVIHE